MNVDEFTEWLQARDAWLVRCLTTINLTLGFSGPASRIIAVQEVSLI